MNESRYFQPYTVLPGVCDHTGRLGYAQAFTICQDLATVHAEALGIGFSAMAQRGLFWLTVRTRLRFLRRPRIMEQLTLETYPVTPGKVRCLRDYHLRREDGTPCIDGVTEWAVLETATGQLQRIDVLMPPEVVPAAEASDPAPFARIDEDFGGAALRGTHTVDSADIDLGRHMNNVAYLRAFLSLFSTKELDALPIRQIELTFRRPCKEGETLRYFTRPAEDGLDFAAFVDDGKPVLLGKIICA